MRARLLIAVGALLGLLLAGCSASVRVPADLAGDDLRPVFFIEHGWHSSLVLAREDGTVVRWVYGEWRWYALDDTGALRAVPTLFWPTQGALGRRELDGPATARSIEARTRVLIDAVHELAAPPEAVDALLEKLDGRFENARDTWHFSRLYDLAFVHDARRYTLARNSNHVVADWLRALGFEVRGNPTIGRWRVVEDAAE